MEGIELSNQNGQKATEFQRDRAAWGWILGCKACEDPMTLKFHIILCRPFLFILLQMVSRKKKPTLQSLYDCIALPAFWWTPFPFWIKSANRRTRRASICITFAASILNLCPPLPSLLPVHPTAPHPLPHDGAEVAAMSQLPRCLLLISQTPLPCTSLPPLPSPDVATTHGVGACVVIHIICTDLHRRHCICSPPSPSTKVKEIKTENMNGSRVNSSSRCRGVGSRHSSNL